LSGVVWGNSWDNLFIGVPNSRFFLEINDEIVEQHAHNDYLAYPLEPAFNLPPKDPKSPVAMQNLKRAFIQKTTNLTSMPNAHSIAMRVDD